MIARVASASLAQNNGPLAIALALLLSLARQILKSFNPLMHPRSQPPSSRFPPSSHRSMAATSSSSISQANGYVCDTLPPARLANARISRSPSPVPPPTPPVVTFKAPMLQVAQQDDAADSTHEVADRKSAAQASPPGRKLCVRHQRMADEGTNLKLQQVSPRHLCAPFFLSSMRTPGALRDNGVSLSHLMCSVNPDRAGVLRRLFDSNIH